MKDGTNQLFHKSHVDHKTQHHISQVNQRKNPESQPLRLDIPQRPKQTNKKTIVETVSSNGLSYNNLLIAN